MLLLLLAEEEFMEAISHPPGSMWFILLLSSIIAVIITILNRLLVDTKELQRKQLIQKAHQEEKQEIIKLADTDPDKYRKARKR